MFLINISKVVRYFSLEIKCEESFIISVKYRYATTIILILCTVLY